MVGRVTLLLVKYTSHPNHTGTIRKQDTIRYTVGFAQQDRDEKVHTGTVRDYQVLYQPQQYQCSLTYRLPKRKGARARWCFNLDFLTSDYLSTVSIRELQWCEESRIRIDAHLYARLSLVGMANIISKQLTDYFCSSASRTIIAFKIKVWLTRRSLMARFCNWAIDVLYCNSLDNNSTHN